LSYGRSAAHKVVLLPALSEPAPGRRSIGCRGRPREGPP